MKFLGLDVCLGGLSTHDTDADIDNNNNDTSGTIHDYGTWAFSAFTSHEPKSENRYCVLLGKVISR